ncbi:MAG: RdgB/HAM1 family non-canonical purine NTP pyrophosphatase [Candidatus Omnitrophica bacterium]|jgi:XTP/dITP diphosphohydrolase|nr:RdgB/HAM1 family non-canonical purine NTP pyrophosphatase [Candidatus Omnitrophota bacterium]MDD5518744.1 RdgB/HAM1 family non-canonical purine NTP pyrophosphatase [Candidatus Omnitrophota bacterium]
MELIVATRNKKKLKEIKAILKGSGFKISSLADYGQVPKIIENGKTFGENAAKKAVKIARFTGKLTLGEDSGLCVDALAGAPGIYSSRFSGKPVCPAGRNKSDSQNNLKLLRLLKGLPLSKRKAHYSCAVALADNKGLFGVVEGRCAGLIGFALKGRHGFGYDPLFVIPKYKKTFAQLGEKIKHRMSHRYRALRKAGKIIKKYIEKD